MPFPHIAAAVAAVVLATPAVAQGGDPICARDVIVAQSMQRQALDQLEQADGDAAKNCRVWRRHVDTMRRVAAVYARCLSGTERTVSLGQVRGSEKEFGEAIRERCTGL